jgi:hypothetical protein
VKERFAGVVTEHKGLSEMSTLKLVDTVPVPTACADAAANSMVAAIVAEANFFN